MSSDGGEKKASFFNCSDTRKEISLFRFQKMTSFTPRTQIGEIRDEDYVCLCMNLVNICQKST